MSDRINNLREQLGPQGNQVAKDGIRLISSLHPGAKIAFQAGQNQAFVYEALNNGRAWMARRLPKRVLSSSLALVGPTIEKYRAVRNKVKARAYYGEKHEYSAWKKELGFTWIEAEDQLKASARHIAKSLIEILKPSDKHLSSRLVKAELWVAKKYLKKGALQKLEDLLAGLLIDKTTTENVDKKQKQLEALKKSLSDLGGVKDALYRCWAFKEKGYSVDIFHAFSQYGRFPEILKKAKKLPFEKAFSMLLRAVNEEVPRLRAEIAKKQKSLVAHKKQTEFIARLSSPKLLRQAVDARLIQFIDGKHQVRKKTILVDQVGHTQIIRACGEEAKKLGFKVGMSINQVPKNAWKTVMGAIQKFDREKEKECFMIFDLSNPLNAKHPLKQAFPDLETALGNRLLDDAKKKVGGFLWSLIRFIFNFVAKDYFKVQSLEDLARRTVRNGMCDIRGPLPYMMIREVGNHFKTKVLPKTGELESSDTPYLGDAILSLKKLAWDWVKPDQPVKKGLLWKCAEKIAKMKSVHKTMNKRLGASMADLVRAIMKEQPLKAHHAILKTLDQPSKKSVIEKTIASYKDGMSFAEFRDRFSDHAKSLPLDMHIYLGGQVRPVFLLLTEGKTQEALKLWKNDVRKKQIRELRNLRGRIIVDLKSLKRKELELFDSEVEASEMAKWERTLSREALRLNERKKKFGLADTRIDQLNALRPLSSNKFEELVKWAEQKIEELGAEIRHLEGKAGADLEEKRRAMREFGEKNSIELSDPVKLLKMDGERFYEGVMRQLTSLMAG